MCDVDLIVKCLFLLWFMQNPQSPILNWINNYSKKKKERIKTSLEENYYLVIWFERISLRILGEQWMEKWNRVLWVYWGERAGEGHREKKQMDCDLSLVSSWFMSDRTTHLCAVYFPPLACQSLCLLGEIIMK